MSLLGQLRSFIGGSNSGYVQFVDSRGMFEDFVLGLSPADMFRTQPHLRTVVTFLARNIGQLGVHTYQRVSDTDRKRERADPVALLLKSPNDRMTTYDLVYRWVADMALYDEALWLLEPNLDRECGWELQPIPPSWINRFGGGDHFGPGWVEIQPPGAVKPTRVPAENYMHFHGWDPTNLNTGSTPVAALKATLQEQIHAVGYRDQIWRRAGRVGVTVTRPAPQSGQANWTADQKRQFKEVLDSKMSGVDGSDAGGSIILEDGMTLKREGFSAHEEQFVENAKLALATVAQVYHVNPTMIGALENANYSNVREFRRMLYGETLGPTINMLTSAVNSFLVPRVAIKPDLYVEFNVQEKLKGSFEEQAAVMSTLVGRPIFTMNEGRAVYNMPEIEGGDDVVTPLNVLIGGQSSPRDGTTAGGGGAQSALPAGASEGDPVANTNAAGWTADEVNKLVSAASGLIRSGFAPAAALEAVGLDPIEHLGLLPVTVQKPVETDGDVDAAIQDALKAAGEVHQWRVIRVLSGKHAPAALEAPGKAGPAAPSEVPGRIALDSKARAGAGHEQNTQRVLQAFFKRQRASVLSAMGAKAADWWDTDRWNKELGDDLYRLAVLTATQIGEETAEALGFAAGDYSRDRTLRFLRAVADDRAESINAATQLQLEAAAGEEGGPAQVFDVAENQRSGAAALALVTFFSAFATVEAAKQVGGDQTEKVWRTNSRNPRAAHAKMDGERVPIGATFSNGAEWPGDPTLGADGVAGCKCSVEVVVG